MKCFLLFVFFIWATTTKAQTFELVKDIYPGESYEGDPNSSYPTGFTEYNGKLYFEANDHTHGKELWVSDGTTGGTELVKDIHNTPSTQLDGVSLGLRGMGIVIFNGEMFFPGFSDAGVSGQRSDLWVSDGTTEGTQMLEENTDPNMPRHLTESDGKLFFRGPGQYDFGLWFTEGSPGSTELVSDDFDICHESTITEFNGEIYFVAIDTLGCELFVSDGTATGTHLVKDIRTGEDSSNPERFIEFNGALYFSANDGEQGTELWKTDGTTAGTQLVKNINVEENNQVRNSHPRNFKVYNDKLYFQADDGVHGKELWVTDGTTEGTALFKDINQASEGPNNSSPGAFKKYEGKLYFGAITADSNGDILWVTDGTEAGTQPLEDAQGNQIKYPGPFIEYDEKLYFRARGTGIYNAGAQLWSTDGTAEGTAMEIMENSTNPKPIGFTPNFTVVDDALYFRADYDNNGQELWKFTAEGMSIEDYDKNNFTIYPNPVEDILNLKSKSDNIQAIELFSITGKFLKSWSEQTEINLSGFAPGNYIIQISTSDGLKTSEQIIKR